ncbi:MAG TPA: peptidylprolyl isomerase [Candidatus Limnocylindrales bacterium]
MATSSIRQRKLARAKLDRQLARRAERERRKRQIRAVAAGVTTLAVAVLAGMWIGGVFDKKPAPPVDATGCTWNTQNVSANTNLKDVGVPPTTGINASGTSVMTLQLNTGQVGVTLDRTTAKCGAESLRYLAMSGYFNNTKCHELTNNVNGQFALRCGDHSGTGEGGAAYTWVPENVPPRATASETPGASASPQANASPDAAATTRYPKGTVAMQPGITGSQFLIFFQDSPAPEGDYSVVGYVTTGWEAIDKIVAAGTVDNGKGANTKPKDEVTITSLTVTDPAQPSGDPTPDPSTQPLPSATPSS